MASISISVVENEYPNKTEKELAELLAVKNNYAAVIRYKAGKSVNYTDFGCCSNIKELERYLTNPYCHDPEILFDRRTDMGEQMVDAIYDRKVKSLHKLLKQGANPNSLNGSVQNPLLISVLCINLDNNVRKEMIETLLKYGADPSIENANGATALEVASQNGYIDCVHMLLSKTKDIDLINRALDATCNFGDNLEVVRTLIEHGADINYKNNRGDTLLHSACYRYRENVGLAMITELLSRNPDIYAKNTKGETALDIAQKYDFKEALALLHEKGA